MQPSKSDPATVRCRICRLQQRQCWWQQTLLMQSHLLSMALMMLLTVNTTAAAAPLLTAAVDRPGFERICWCCIAYASTSSTLIVSVCRVQTIYNHSLLFCCIEFLWFRSWIKQNRSTSSYFLLTRNARIIADQVVKWVPLHGLQKEEEQWWFSWPSTCTASSCTGVRLCPAPFTSLTLLPEVTSNTW
jgi:hypothetical protein